MRLLVIVKFNPFFSHGAFSNRLLGLLKGINLQGSNIKILITGGYTTNEEEEKFGRKGTYESIEYCYLSYYSNNTLNKRRLAEYIFGFALFELLKFRYVKILREINANVCVWITPDLFHFQLIKKTRKTKFVNYFMEINEFPDIHLFNGSTKYFWQNRKIERSNYLFFNFVLPQVDGLALMTKTLEEYFATKTGSKTKTIHLPMTVDLSRFDLTKVYDRHGDIHCPYIAFLGSMNDLKDGVNILIESFISLSADFPNYNLFIFGFWGYDSKKHLQLIQESQMGHRILYSRPINNTEVEKVLMNASVLVLPRPNSYQAQGGFPTKLGEYLATGNPVISTRVGEIDNYLINNENVFFCEPGSVQSLTSTLRYVLKNYDFAKKIGRRGRLVAEKVFSIDVQTKRLFYFLKNLQ